MKYLYIDKNTKRVKMESQKKMDLPQFEIVKINEGEILDGYSAWYKDGKLIKNEVGENVRQKAKRELEKATTMEELKSIINQLL
jgi:hypothetical protein